MKATIEEHKERIKKAEMILHYRFKSKNILLDALNRRDQKITSNLKDSVPDTPRTLAMMGDKVLDLCLFEREYDSRLTKPGDLDFIRQESARNKTLAIFTKKYFSIENIIIWSENERTEEIWKKMAQKKIATLFESLIGSIYLDAHRKGRDGVAQVDLALNKMKFWEFVELRRKAIGNR